MTAQELKVGDRFIAIDRIGGVRRLACVETLARGYRLAVYLDNPAMGCQCLIGPSAEVDKGGER